MSLGIPSFDRDAGLHAVSPELLLQEIESGRRITIVDVRGADEFRGPSGRLPHARSLPLHQMIARRPELLEHRHDRIVIVSYRGIRSRIAAFALALSGFTDVVSLEGGMQRWLDLGYPVERGGPVFHPGS